MDKMSRIEEEENDCEEENKNIEVTKGKKPLNQESPVIVDDSLRHKSPHKRMMMIHED